jgi:hypothetical protein
VFQKIFLNNNSKPVKIHLKLRVLYFIFTLLFSCKVKEVRLADPFVPLEYSKQGLVAFGLYSFSEFGFYKKQIGSQIELIKIQLVEIISIDEKNKIVESIDLNQYQIGEKEYPSNNSFPVKNFNTIVIENVNKKYAIKSFSYILGNGKSAKLVTCDFNVYNSFKILPIQNAGRKINFLGIYYKNDIDASNTNEPKCDNYQFKEKVVTLENNQDLISNHRNLVEAFYLGMQIEPKYAELKFLRDFIDSQKEGDWKLKAEERLNALGYKYENGFLIEVEAKKK